MDSTLRLPVLVGGQRISVDDCDDIETIPQASGDTIALPRIEPDMLDQAIRSSATAADELRRMSIDDITIFFDEVGSAWRNPSCEWRNLVVERGPAVTGYPRAFIDWDVGLIGVVLTRGEQYDFLETDLGDPTMLDEWDRTKAVYRRYLPKGLIAHIMVGNVPMASLFTLYRSLVTKNLTVAKVPSRDPLTSLAFANCVHDVDPQHPIARALSAMYWQPESEIENLVIETADVVSVWGQAKSVESIKQRIPCGTDVIEFGPKRSVSLIFDGTTDAERAATKMAFDIMSYEQEGCFSMQEAFVVGDPEPLVSALTQALAGASTRFAKQQS
jgi:long-chain-fatty-acyl-CoA reductase